MGYWRKKLYERAIHHNKKSFEKLHFHFEMYLSSSLYRYKKQVLSETFR